MLTLAESKQLHPTRPRRPQPDALPEPLPTLRTPVATDPTIVGTLCDHRAKRHPLVPEPQHLGCPGWWGKSKTDKHASTCACSCHEQIYGWPQWEAARLGTS